MENYKLDFELCNPISKPFTPIKFNKVKDGKIAHKMRSTGCVPVYKFHGESRHRAGELAPGDVFTASCTTMDWHEFGGCPLCERERRRGGREEEGEVVGKWRTGI